MENWVNIFKALAEETRFEIIKLLLKHKLCVRALANHLKITESPISQHLKILHQAGVVKREKCGYYTHYSVNKNKLIEIGGKNSSASPKYFNLFSFSKYSFKNKGRKHFISSTTRRRE